jgi:hypothetical protein
MHARYLLSAALLGGLVGFGWGAFTHNVLPASQPLAFTDSTAVVQAVHANAPSNGIYYDQRGLFAAVALHGDLGPRYSSLLYPITHQLVIEIVVAGLLAWVLLRLPVWPASGTGFLLATVALAAGIDQLLPNANWYGFPLRFQLVALADLVVGWFLVGWVIGWLRNRMLRAEAR